MPDSTIHATSQRPAARLSAWRIEQLASALCDVRRRGSTPYCVIHGNVVGAGSVMCGHVRLVVAQLVEIASEAERLRVSVAVVPGEDPVEMVMEVSA